MTQITLHCSHVSENSVHCNRYTSFNTSGIGKTISEMVEEKEWDIIRGQAVCPDHQ